MDMFGGNVHNRSNASTPISFSRPSPDTTCLIDDCTDELTSENNNNNNNNNNNFPVLSGKITEPGFEPEYRTDTILQFSNDDRALCQTDSSCSTSRADDRQTLPVVTFGTKETRYIPPVKTSKYWWWCTPSCIKERISGHSAWLSIRWFCAAMCFLILVHGALCTGYLMSVITTIEKRFEIRSQTSGLVVSSYELGSLLSVLIVSYYGSRGHIPRFIGIGALILATGSMLFSLPHFLAGPPLFNLTSINRKPDLCNINGPDAGNSQTCDDGIFASLNVGSASHLVFILVIAQVLLGIGGSPMFTLGTTYIDNHVDKDSSSFYLAFMYISVAFGPVCGFLLGAAMLSKYVYPPKPVDLPDSAFIGLWWGGFMILGLLYLLASLPFFGFPQRLPLISSSFKNNKNNNNNNDQKLPSNSGDPGSNCNNENDKTMESNTNSEDCPNYTVSIDSTLNEDEEKKSDETYYDGIRRLQFFLMAFLYFFKTKNSRKWSLFVTAFL